MPRQAEIVLIGTVVAVTEAEPTIWINGALVAGADAGISPLDHGVTVGDGVFETLKIVGDVPFALTRHLARLRRNGAATGLDVPADDETRNAAHAVCAANPGGTKLRITLSSGTGPSGSRRGDGPHTFIMFVDHTPLNHDPLSVVIVPWTRNESGALAGIKSTSYAENVLALRWAQRSGADEAIFANTRGELCEGTGANIFLALDGQLITPPLGAGCLAGITRQLVIEVCDVNQRPVPIEALAGADEAFLTSSTREVVPITSVDGRAMAAVMGPRTAAASEAFAAKAADIDP